MKIFAVIGTGGMGRETMVLAARQLAAEVENGAHLLFAVEEGHSTESINGYQVKTLTDFLRPSSEELFFSVAIADSKARRRITAECEYRKAASFDVVAEESMVYEGSTYGSGAILAPFSMISTNSRIGRSLHLNYYACITHDCEIGDFVTFGPKAQCNGNVVINDGVYVGSGALIIQGCKAAPLKIGENAIIGMGAVVLADVPPNCTVAGNPARVIKTHGKP